MIFEKSSYISVQHIPVNVCASEHLCVPIIYHLMSTVGNHHIGSIFGNWLLFIPVFSILSCIVLCACHLSSPVSISPVCRSLCLCCMQSPCTWCLYQRQLRFRISVFNQHHVMAHPVHPIKTGQCVPYDDISCGPYTIRVNIHITHYGCRLGPYKEFFLRDIYIPGFDIALALCRLLTMLLFFPGCWFELFHSSFFYVYYMMSGIGKAVPYHCLRGCFEHCALVLLNVAVSFSLLISGWIICHWPCIETYDLGFLKLCNFGSTNVYLPECFCPCCPWAR